MIKLIDAQELDIDEPLCRALKGNPLSEEDLDAIKRAPKSQSWRINTKFYVLSENIMRLNVEFFDEDCWWNICKYQELSENFIREFKDFNCGFSEACWDLMSKYQKLSENFIREFEKKVYWRYIFGYQKLSEGFLIEFIDRLSNPSLAYLRNNNKVLKDVKDRIIAMKELMS
jgi:hypothetical protein